jgi:hypothetical protein
MACIFCSNGNSFGNVEHIVPESMGNTNYILDKGIVCDSCNSRFSSFEKKAQGSTIFGHERARLGHKNKDGNPVKGKTGGVEFTGSKEFKKNEIVVKGLEKAEIISYNRRTGRFKIRIQGFDKSEVATSKFLLKIAFEALFKSKPELWAKYDFSNLIKFVRGIENKDWPFISPKKELIPFLSIPENGDEQALNEIPCQLRISEVDSDNLIFRFVYASKNVAFEINLLNRNLEWIKPHIPKGNIFCVYPRHFDKYLGIPPGGVKVKTPQIKYAKQKQSRPTPKRKKPRKVKSRSR